MLCVYNYLGILLILDSIFDGNPFIIMLLTYSFFACYFLFGVVPFKNLNLSSIRYIRNLPKLIIDF